eukprot:11204246-Lingulodinium_polyedra.AAC.1
MGVFARWPKSWKSLDTRRPVCRFWTVLYGRPDSGTFWEQKCDSHAQSLGLSPLDPSGRRVTCMLPS